jgi:ABC-2 type transport system ATP-binding protein
MLEVMGLTKRYGPVVALDGATFSAAPGRIVGFLGANAAGKTTTMRCIFGLVRPDSGEVRWRGRAVGPAERLRFGYMPEQRGLYPKMKVGDQLVWLARMHGMDAAAAAAAAEGWLDAFSLADRRTDTVEALSHGNQQRVQLIAALLHDPELLVLDEPFNGLDPIGAETMARVLRERAAAGTAVLFSSHQLDVVEDLCEDVAIIDQGRIVLTGDVRELKASSNRRVLEVEAGAGGGDLLDDLDGVLSSTFDGHRHRVVVDAATDVRHVLAAADRDITVQHLSYSTPSLSELFKEVVA